VGEHEQVRQVGARQEQRRGVGHEHAAVEERLVVDPPPASQAHQDRRQEHHGAVQRQGDGDDGDQHHGEEEQRAGADPQPRHPIGDGGEQSVPVGGHPDQQEPRHQREGRPRLPGGGQRGAGARHPGHPHRHRPAQGQGPVGSPGDVSRLLAASRWPRPTSARSSPRALPAPGHAMGGRRWWISRRRNRAGPRRKRCANGRACFMLGRLSSSGHGV
jgi:hypothetical protein